MPLIVLEGIDGCGKSTQHAQLVAQLKQHDIDPVLLREPGGTVLGEKIRQILLDPATEACAEAELFAYQVARAQLVRTKLMPLVADGAWVVLDRFWYSTIAYQAYGLGLDLDRVRGAIELAIGDLVVDRALYLRIDVATAVARRQASADDRIEARGSSYQEQVRRGYEALAAEGSLTAIEANRAPEAVAADVWAAVATLL